MKLFFSDKYGRTIECENFKMFRKFDTITAAYILDKKRKCLIVNEEIGLELLQEKKNEDKCHA